MKALHAVIFLSLLGAFAHQTVGAALATLGVLLVLPPAAGLLTLAAILRVGVPLLLPGWMAEAGVLIPAFGWIAAWSLLLRRYAGWLLGP